jgi:hypothetical protein
MFKILGTYIVVGKNIYKMQHLEGSGTPVLYIRRTVLKGPPSPVSENTNSQNDIFKANISVRLKAKVRIMLYIHLNTRISVYNTGLCSLIHKHHLVF